MYSLSKVYLVLRVGTSRPGTWRPWRPGTWRPLGVLGVLKKTLKTLCGFSENYVSGFIKTPTKEFCLYSNKSGECLFSSQSIAIGFNSGDRYLWTYFNNMINCLDITSGVCLDSIEKNNRAIVSIGKGAMLLESIDGKNIYCLTN